MEAREISSAAAAECFTLSFRDTGHCVGGTEVEGTVSSILTLILTRNCCYMAALLCLQNFIFSDGFSKMCANFERDN